MDSPVSHWTNGRYRSFITSVIRSGFVRFPNKYIALEVAYTQTKVNNATGRKAKHYECNVCKKEFVNKDIQIDHKLPATPTTGFVSWDHFIEGLFCSLDNLQALCRGCHKIKSKAETEERTKARKNK